MTSQLEMFPPPCAMTDGVVVVVAPFSTAKRRNERELDDEAMVRHLEKSGNYRVLRRLVLRAVVGTPRPGFPHLGVIVDTETTGLDHRKDEIIEIGAVAFTFDDDGTIGDVTGVYGGLQQPLNPIPPEITRLTGITDEMVAGQVIDMAKLRSLIAPADLVIATMLPSIAPSARHYRACSRTRPGPARSPRSTWRHAVSKGRSSAI